MKKHLFLLIGLVCILATPSLFAQKTSKNPSLIGVWQMCIPAMRDAISIDSQTGKISLDTTKLKVTPIYKILGTGGDFTNLSFNPESPRIWASGTYSIESTSVYVEHVKQHNNPAYNNKDNKLSYYFYKNNYWIFTYKTPDTEQQTWEIYRRVPGDIPR